MYSFKYYRYSVVAVKYEGINVIYLLENDKMYRKTMQNYHLNELNANGEYEKDLRTVCMANRIILDEVEYVIDLSTDKHYPKFRTPYIGVKVRYRKDGILCFNEYIEVDRLVPISLL